MKLWKRNLVVVAIALFVGVAVYLNWHYAQNEVVSGDADAAASGKLLGEAALVSGQGDAQESPSADGSDSSSGGSASGQTGYFDTARLNRQQARDNALELLQEAAADTSAAQEVIDNANESIQTLATYTVSEAQMENLIISKGYSDCVCFLADNSISVVVPQTEAGLTEADTARILEIVMEQTGMTADQVTIVETMP